MKLLQTPLEGVYTIQPEMHTDERGFFSRVYCSDEIASRAFPFPIAQINRSLTRTRGTIRGMHFQREPHSEDKMMQCIAGSMFSVALDVRKDSATFGRWHAEELSASNRSILLIPKGFAYGFQALSDNCEALYFMSQAYSADHASGVRFDDPFFNIQWPLPPTFISDRDLQWPLIKT